MQFAPERLARINATMSGSTRLAVETFNRLARAWAEFHTTSAERVRR